MTTIVTRITNPTGGTAKGSPLSSAEIDANFINLNDSKLEITDLTSTNTVNKGVKRDASGNFSAGTITAVSLVETSTYKVKENIQPITGALDSMLQLTGVTYDRKDKSSKNEAGLIAEEVNKILPNVVAKDANGDPEGINYTKLTAYLIEAVKELKQEIEELKGNSPPKEEKKKGIRKWLF
jgi:hypothetical protein